MCSGRSNRNCDCFTRVKYNRAWSKELQKEVRLWKHERGTGRDGKRKWLSVSFLTNEPDQHLRQPRINAKKLCLNIHTKGTIQLC